MDLEVGGIYEGKVTGIAAFGAFVLLGPGKTGLVHISEISNSYVEDVSKFLEQGQQVRVKLISIDNQGRINLSIKKAMEEPEKPVVSSVSAPAGELLPKTADEIFEDKLKQFLQSSEKRISELKNQKERKYGKRR